MQPDRVPHLVALRIEVLAVLGVRRDLDRLLRDDLEAEPGDAGLARAGGKNARSADILAHQGWAHWLNQKLAQREFGPAAERDLRDALRIDPSNVFANAMLANWMMQTGGSTKDALLHFQTALQQNRKPRFVRQLQLGVLTYPRDSETHWP